MQRRDLSKLFLGSAAGAVLAVLPAGAQACSATAVYDARAYGACGDGVQDDGPALQAWLNAIPADGTEFLPAAPNFYLVGATLTRTTAVSIRGEGRRSKIQYAGTGAAMIFKNCRFSTFSNFLLTGVGNKVANTGIRFEGAQECLQLIQVFVEEFQNDANNSPALFFSDSWTITIVGGAFRQSSTGILCDESTFSVGPTCNVVNAMGVDCSDNAIGIAYRSGSLLNVHGCDFTGCKISGVDVGCIPGAVFVGAANILGSWFEGSGDGVRVGLGNTAESPPKDVDIRNNFFGNTGNHIRLYKADRTRIGESQWGPGQVIIDAGVTRTTVQARGVTVVDNSAAGQTGYYQYDQLMINDVQARNSLRVGTGAYVTRLLSGTATIDFPSVAHGSHASASVTVTGAALGDVVVGLSHSGAVPAGALLVGDVTSANTVTAKLMNLSGAAVNLAGGTVRAVVARVI